MPRACPGAPGVCGDAVAPSGSRGCPREPPPLQDLPVDDDLPTTVVEFLRRDHARLEELLACARASGDHIDEEPYEAFREGLLQHIAMEEKVLFPQLAGAEGRLPPDVERLHKDHGWIASMLTIRPAPWIVDEIEQVLEHHNAKEEGAEGVYARVDAAVGSGALDLVERMRNLPRVKVAPYRKGRNAPR